MQEQRQTSKPHSVEMNPENTGEEFRERVRSLRLPQQTKGGATRRLTLTILSILCVGFASSTGVLGYMWYVGQMGSAAGPEAPAQSSKATAAEATSAKPIALAPPASSGTVVLEWTGYIIPAHQILVSPKVNGMVTRLDITESQRVKKGDTLAVLEDTEFRADRDRAKAMLESARQNLAELEKGYRPEEIEQSRADLAEAEAQRVQLVADFKRATELLEKKVLSRESYDSTQSKFQAMERRIQHLKLGLALMVEGPRIERKKAARAQFEQAEAELAKAEWRLSNCTIRAPISGTILKKNAEEGSLVNPIAQQGFFSLCEMADLSDLEVELEIQERDVSKVVKNQKCEVRAKAYPDIMYPGIVSRLMPTANRGKGSIPVRVKVTMRPGEEEGKYLKPQMEVMVSFLKN